MSRMEHARMSSSSSYDESPKSKTSTISSTSNNNNNNNSARKPSKSGSPTNDMSGASRFSGSGVEFRGKLIGVEEVAEARGDKMCQIAMAKLKAGVRAARDHKQRILISVSLEGIRIVDEKSTEVMHLHEVNRISFISRDLSDSRAFGYVYRRKEGTHQFFGIKTEKTAEGMVLTLRDMFQAVFEMKKRQANANNDNSDTAGTETGSTDKSDSKEDQSEAKSDEEKDETTAENLLNLEVEFQNLSKASGAPPISPVWTTVDPWKPTGQTGVVGVPGLNMAASGPVQLYQGPPAVISAPYGYVGPVGPAPWPGTVHQAPITGPSPYNGDAWVVASQQQRPPNDTFAYRLARPNVPPTVVPPLIPARADTVSSPGNPFLPTSAAVPSPTAAGFPDPFAELATGMLGGAAPQSHQPGKKTDKRDFFPEPPKPSLVRLSRQQQQQQQADDETALQHYQYRQQQQQQQQQQANVDIFGAPPFPSAMTTASDPFA